MNAPRDSAITDAQVEKARAAHWKFWHKSSGDNEYCEREAMRRALEAYERTRELDAAQPAAAGELPEAVAWQEFSNGRWTELAKERYDHLVHIKSKYPHLEVTDVRAIYTADQLRAAVAGAQDKLDRTLDAMDRLHARAVKAEAAVAELQETIDEGKRQWDQVAALIGAVGDDVDDVLAKAAPVAGYRRDAEVLSAMLHEGVPRSVAGSVVRLLQEGSK